MARSFFVGDLVELTGGNLRNRDIGIILFMENMLGMWVAEVMWSDGVIMPCSETSLIKLN